MLNQIVGKNIRRLRETKNFSQEAVSMAINISHVTYGKIENGCGVVSLERLEKFAEFFGVDVYMLLSLSEEKDYNTITPQMIEEKAKEYNQINMELVKCCERLRGLQEQLKLQEEKIKDKEMIIKLLTGEAYNDIFQLKLDKKSIEPNQS